MKGLFDKLSRFYGRLLEEKCPELAGSVDAFEQNRFLSGWAQDKNNPGQPLQVLVELGGKQIAAGRADLTRADGLSGYRIDTQNVLSIMDIAENRVRVIAVARDGTQAQLGRHYPFIQTIMKRLFPPI